MADYELLKAIAHSALPHNLQTRQVTAPAVANDFTITVPGGEAWRLLAVSAQLATDANAANRFLSLIVDDQTNVMAQLPVGPAITASLTTRVSFVADLGMGPMALTGNSIAASIPSLALPSGSRLRWNTQNIQAGDQYSAITVTFEMLNEPPWLNLLTGTHEEETVHDALQAAREGEMS